MKLVMATHNKGKLAELGKALGSSNELLSIGDFTSEEPDENGLTLEENSLIKAEHAYLVTLLPSVADDTGLFVDALGGRPGIYSARYASTDRERVEKMLKELEGIPLEKRTAHFSCCISYVGNGIRFTVEGRCDGHISFSPFGKEGFGYDPIFVPDGGTQSFSELGIARKNEISHRGKAIRLLIQELKKRNLL